MRLLLLILLLFLFPSVALANEINGESNQNFKYSSSNITNIKNRTHICTNVNGKETCYDSDKGGNVSVYNDGTTSRVTVNNEAQTPNSIITPFPTPVIDKQQTEVDIKAQIASEQAKLKKNIDETKKRLEEQKTVLSAHSFNLQTFIEDLFKRIFHF